MKGELTGGCLCGAVRYTINPGFRLPAYACHCTDCQSRTGSAFSEHMLFQLDSLEISGELDEGHFSQPSDAQSTIYGCAKCRSRIYATNDERDGLASLRCGTLDNSSAFVPSAHIWVKSKQPWIELPEGVKVMDEQPRSTEEWVAFLGAP